MSQVRWSVTQGPNQKSWGGGGKQMTLYKVGGGGAQPFFGPIC